MEETALAGLPWGGGEVQSLPQTGSSPGQGITGSWATCHCGGCQLVLVPVQEPPVRTCWPPALAAPARTAASARSRRTTRASPAVAPLAGKVWAWPFWGLEPPTPLREGEAGGGSQACERVLTCPMAQLGGQDVTIACIPWFLPWCERCPRCHCHSRGFHQHPQPTQPLSCSVPRSDL